MENPETDDYYNYKGLPEYAWSHAVKSNQEYEKVKKKYVTLNSMIGRQSAIEQ